MRKCRNFLRILSSRTALKATFIKLSITFLLILLAFAFVQEKQEKEALIELALKTRSVDELVEPNNDTVILSVDGRQDRNPFVVIVVTSLPQYFHRRNIIRHTWAYKAAEYGITVVFFLGKPESPGTMANLIAESQKYHDLVVDDFPESYYALAIKTLRVFKYFKFHHPKSKFLVKTDDDVFVNLPNLLQYCNSINKGFELEKGYHNSVHGYNSTEISPSYFIGGVVHSDRGPHTWNPFSKWYAPSDVWRTVYNKVTEMIYEANVQTGGKVGFMSENTYPPYTEGNFYIVSDDAVVDILKVSRRVPLYHLEDVYITGVLASWVLNIVKQDIPFISSSSNTFPRLSYMWLKLFVSPKEIIAFHCDNYVELISLIHQESGG